MIKIVTRHLALLAFLGVPVSFVAGQGCTVSTQLCDLFCECEHCNDRQEDDCQIVVQESLDRGAAYQCETEVDAYWDCALQKNDCDDNVFSVDEGCNDERDDLYECVDDNSDIIGSVNAAPGPAQGQTPASQGTQTTQRVCTCTVCECATCSIGPTQRACPAGEAGCESCDVVCTDACLMDTTCGGLSMSDGQCLDL